MLKLITRKVLFQRTLPTASEPRNIIFRKSSISMFWSTHTSMFCFFLPLGIGRAIPGKYPKHHRKSSRKLWAPPQGWQIPGSPHQVLYGHNHLKEVTCDHVNILIFKELFRLPGCLKTRADLPSSVCSFSCRQAYMEKRFSSLIHDITHCPAHKSHPRWRSKSRLPATHGQHLLLESSTAQQVISANFTPLGNKWPFSCMGCQNRGKKCSPCYVTSPH